MNNQDWEDGYEMGYKIGLKEGTDKSWHKWNLKEGYVKSVSEVDITRMFYSPLYRYEDGKLNYIAFAEAILRKAQKK